MANVLDNRQKILALDSQNMLGSLELLTNQIKQIIKQAQRINFPASYRRVDKVIIAGMGGSTLGSHIIKTLYQDKLGITLEIVNHYSLPAYVDSRTLVVASSYSGTTEEALAAAEDALKRKAKVAIISSGGKLAEWAMRNKLPALIFTTENNPCGSPRMGLGYSIFGQLILLSKMGIIKISNKEFTQVIKTIEKYGLEYGVGNNTTTNLVKQLAEKIQDRSVWYLGAEHLVGSIHTATNQMNENAKRFAGYFVIPELNHHLMEGMLQPRTNGKNIVFLLIQSSLYNEKVQKRFNITRQVLERNGIESLIYACQEKNKLLQVCEVLVFGSYLSYYLAMLNNIDPTAIPFVDFFKAELNKKK